MEDVAAGIIGLIIILFIFLIFRELICWYFKINKIVEIQENLLIVMQSINKELKLLNINSKDKNKDKETLEQ